MANEPLMDMVFDPLKFMAALEVIREERQWSYRKLAEEAGVRASSTVLRLKEGRPIGVNNTIALLGMLGSYDLTPFLRKNVVNLETLVHQLELFDEENL